MAAASGLLVLLRLVPRLQTGALPAQYASFVPFGILGWLLILLAGLWRGRRDRRWRVAAAASVAMIGLQVSFLAPRYRAEASRSCSARLRLMSQNLQLGQGAGSRVVAQAQDADIVILVEATTEAVHRLDAAGMRRRFPYLAGTPDWGAHGSVLYSRWPLRKVNVHPATMFAAAFAQVTVPGAGPVNVAAVHPVNPMTGSGPWMADAHELGAAAHALPAGVPLLMAGDFNATPDHRSLRYLQRLGGLELGEAQAGAGYTATWPVHLPVPTVLPIDHVLVRGSAQVTRVTTTSLPDSDHRGLHATVCLTSDGRSAG